VLPNVGQRGAISRFISIAIATLLLGAGLAALPLTPAFAGDIDAIAGAPSDGTNTDGRSRFSYQIGPGQEITDYYLAQNTGTTVQTLTVFATDAFNTADGSFSLLDTGKKPVDAGSWVTFAGGGTSIEVPLEPRTSKVVTFSVKVPEAARPGDHAGGIVISVRSGSGQVVVDRRVATRMYVRVPGDLQPILSVNNISAAYEYHLNPLDGTTTVTATVKNAGNVALSGKTLVGVTGPFGILLGNQLRTEVSELLPGSSRVVSFQVTGIGQWLYLNPYVKVVPTIDKEALNPGRLIEVDRDTVLFVMPWWLLVLVVIAAIVWLLLRLRRSRDEKKAAAWIQFTEAEARRKALEDSQSSRNANSDASKTGSGDLVNADR
jgi:hypothetical protein